MKRRLRQILTMLCVFALAFGCVSTVSLAEDAEEIRVVCVEWNDENNYDALRPASVEVKFGESASVVLSEANNWTAEVLAPAGAQVVAPEVAGYGKPVPSQDSAILTYTHQVAKTTVSASASWNDGDNAGGIRPESVQLRLLADGKPFGASRTVSEGNKWTASWDDVPVYRVGGKEAAKYTVDAAAPEGYAVSTEDLEAIFTILTGELSLVVSVDAPEDADVSGMQLTISGPDPKMPVNLTLSQITGGRYDFGQVLPGAYVVQENNADTLVEGYEMDPSASQVGDAAYVKAGESALLTFRYTYREPVEDEPDEDPMAGVGKLSIVIDGPDSRMPMTITYADFVGGKYELDGLAPGSYSVIERNAETLVRAYTLKSDSVTGMSITVGKEGATATLVNRYAPALPPEPEPELIDIPVTKTWDDDYNKDKNRPATITVRLYADGVEVDSMVLTEASGWTGTFFSKPRCREDGRTEIVYTVGEDSVTWYTAAVAGTNITNTYQPEVTSVSVRKEWNDNNNALEIRPTSLAVTLLPVGKVYVLSPENGWTMTVDNLPTRIDGKDVTYSWTEQEVIGYVLDSVSTEGSMTTFRNRVTRIPEPPEGTKKPKAPEGEIEIIEEYKTALGVDVMINHVGDCFD